MYFSDNTNRISFSFYEFQIDMILHALELYAYNLHYIGRKSCEEYEESNIILFHLYNEILAHYNNNKINIGYNPIKNCQMEIDRIKKKNYYSVKKYNKKIA